MAKAAKHQTPRKAGSRKAKPAAKPASGKNATAAGAKVPKTRVKLTDAELVTAYMDALKHPLRAEIEAVRTIIKSTDSRIKERIKWNAPSYYYKDDMVTFNPRATEHVHLVFHHPTIEDIPSPLLEGDYKGRRMAYFTTMKDVKTNKKELVSVLKALIGNVEG